MAHQDWLSLMEFLTTKKFHHGFFENQTGNNKISSDLILNDKLELLSFGNDCISYLSSTQEEQFHHFQNIKMGLYKNEENIKARNSDLEIDIKYIITIILKEVKKKAIEQIRRNMPALDEKKMHWIMKLLKMQAFIEMMTIFQIFLL